MNILILIAAFAAFSIFIACVIWRPTRLAIITMMLLRLPVRIAAVGLAFMLLTLPAAAQDSPVAGLVASVTPMLIDLLAIVLMAALTWAAAWAKRKFGIDIEAKHRDAMHSALMTGARLAAARQLTGPAALQLILGYVGKSVPDALATLAPSRAVLTDLADVKLQQVISDNLAGGWQRRP